MSQISRKRNSTKTLNNNNMVRKVMAIVFHISINVL